MSLRRCGRNGLGPREERHRVEGYELERVGGVGHGELEHLLRASTNHEPGEGGRAAVQAKLPAGCWTPVGAVLT